MIAYLDASVILRRVLAEAGQLREWAHIEHGVASDLARIECLRTIDRMRLRLTLGDEDVASRIESLNVIFDRIDLVEVSPQILARAGQPFPTTLGTLDAIHLASALLWQQSEKQALTFLTHDGELGCGARAMGMKVLGVEIRPA